MKKREILTLIYTHYQILIAKSTFILSMNKRISRQITKSSTKLLVLGSFIIFLILLSASWASAQGGNTNWTQPYQLSSGQINQIGDQVMFADLFGYVHLFWPKTGILEDQTILYYSRFDGETWTLPVDILIAPVAPNISATADVEGNLHLIFTNGYTGSVFYTKANHQDAISAQGWQTPQKLDIYAQSIAFRVDSVGVLHLLYSGYYRSEPGVYYTNSVDSGKTWSKSVWLDPDKPPDLQPSKIQLEIGEKNSLHASWYYSDQEYLGRWIRYAHSFDQGQNWSTPFTIDKVEPGSDELRIPYPAMAVNGEDVYLIWAGDTQTHRKYRVSHDSGRTWNQAEFIFGDLHGGAIGDGLALDALGRLHFFGQIRYPQGIYHAFWDQGRWSSPSMVYLIAKDAFEPLGDRIHAHRVRAAVRSGNQLVITFTTSPGQPQSILYEMHMTMPDVPAIDILPLPEQTPASTVDSEFELNSLTPLPDIPTEVPNLDPALDTGPPNANSPSSGLIFGVLPVVLFIIVFLAIRFSFRKNG